MTTAPGDSPCAGQYPNLGSRPSDDTSCLVGVHGNMHPVQPAVGVHEHAHPTSGMKALIVEDMREACIVLRLYGYECDRITHNELMASSGEELTGKLLKGDYALMWLSTPSDWYVRTPDKRANQHWQRMVNWIKRAVNLQMRVVLFGTPGFTWKLPNIKETIEDLRFNMTKMRLSHFGEKYDQQNQLPSGSYIQVATSVECVAMQPQRANPRTCSGLVWENSGTR